MTETRRALATVSKDTKTIKAGTRVKVVMASRFGDVGITTDLTRDRGYDTRVQCVESDILTEIEGITKTLRY